jgi:hypothetical protein
LLESTKNASEPGIAVVFNYLSSNLQTLKSNILNESYFIIETHSELLYELIRIAYEVLQPNSFEQLILMTGTSKLATDLMTVLDFIVNLFPKLPANLVCKCSPILKVIYNLF